VKDPTGGVMQAVTVTISNPVSGFSRTATTDMAGKFVFGNLLPNPYHISIVVQGFQPLDRDVVVRTSVPIDLDLTVVLAGTTASVEVVGRGELVELGPTAHTDIDQSLIAMLPIESSSGLSQVIMKATPGVVADANGFFHPIGDHAQTQFSIDNQPVTDQQSRIYSNQISPDAVQSLEAITGVAPAEFGDKTSLVLRILTKSGLDQSKPTGSFLVGYGSFTSPTGELNVGAGSHALGNFLSVTGMRTDRFLDPPEFAAIHDNGDTVSVFDRLDVHPNDADTLHLNVNVGRSSFDIPNTLDEAANGQAQHQQINNFNVAPGYTQVISSTLLFAANGYVRRDHVLYLPSGDPFADTPATVSQDRSLTNVGAKIDLSYGQGMHNVKVGGSVTTTRLNENFSLGLTAPTFNSPCTDAAGVAAGDTALTSVAQCAKAGLVANGAFLPGLLPFDLSRGGALFTFAGSGTIKQQAAYAQDEIKAGAATVNLGLRLDHYAGLSTATLVEPRLGLSYALPHGGPVLRASYGRSMETPYNENLLLSSTTGANGLANPAFGAQGGVQALQPGKRDEGEVGVQQALGRWVVADVGYFDKFTHNAYDFDVLFDTPIVFPISWDHSHINGFTGRVNLLEHRGFSAYTVLGHTNAIFSNPENGGILFNSPLPSGDFRIDHDQKFQQTTNLQYVFEKQRGVWASLSWQYESGEVAGAVPDYAAALALTADEQAAIGLYCGSTVATPTAPITSCSSSNRGATRLVIPADGTENDLTNPPRIASRNLFDLGLGIDNVLRGARTKVKVRFSIVNLGNTEALYNFLSTFSGTHFVTPRAYQVQAGVTF